MVYDRIRALRQEKGLTQKQVAEYLEVSMRTYGALEQGRRRPKIRRLVALAELFETSVDYPIGLTDQRTRH